MRTAASWRSRFAAGSENEEAVTLLRRVFSAVLVAAFAGFNAQLVDLHVHAATEHADKDHHQHGPALHHHDAAVRMPIDEVRITGVDNDDTVIPVRLCAASASGPKPTAARVVETPVVEGPKPAMVSGTWSSRERTDHRRLAPVLLALRPPRTLSD